MQFLPILKVIHCSQYLFRSIFPFSNQNDFPNNYIRLHPVQQELMDETFKVLEHSTSMMLGAPEVLQMNQVLMKAVNAKKAIDIGVFTGASSLAAALSLPEDGKVIACDVNERFTSIGKLVHLS